jgi:hypothetical protein
MTLDDLDLDSGTAAVLGKGRRPRACPFGAKTAQALDRYLRVRTAERGAGSTNALWLSEKGRGAMLSGGIAQMLKRRGLAAGIAGLHPTNSATPPSTPGSPTAAPRATPCASSAGSPDRCSPATHPVPPTNEPEKPTAASPSATESEG